LPGAAIAPGFRAGRLLLPFGLLAFLEVVMSKRKAKPQSLTIIVVNPLKKSESLPSWEDVVAHAAQVGRPLSVLWPYRGVPEKRLYRKWKLLRAVLDRFVTYAKADLPLSSAMWSVFNETKLAEKPARFEILEHRHS
jgi:hypothetical protein